MNIVIAGASGFVGTALSRFLLEAGHQVTGLGTRASHPLQTTAAFTWIAADTTGSGPWQDAVREADAVVNLAGRTIARRWSRAYKATIVDSRIRTTRHIVAAMHGPDQILVSTSAVGYYGDRGETILNEQAPPVDNFLGRLAVDWENAAHQAEKQGVRVVIMRFGVVLGVGGGALAQMQPAFRRFAGGPLGGGRQWFPWIHMADLLSAVRFLIDRQTAQGPYNFCAPGVVRQKAFAEALGAALGRPAVLPAPAAVLRLVMGEMAGILLASQRVVPERLTAEGFDFRFPQVGPALADLVSRS